MAKSERTEAGRFADGNPGGPGRPRRATERAYLAALADACPPETWRAIVERTVDAAKNGNSRAREWLASYLVGEPQSLATTLRELAIEEATGGDSLDSAVAERQSKAEREEQYRARGLRPGTAEWLLAELAER